MNCVFAEVTDRVKTSVSIKVTFVLVKVLSVVQTISNTGRHLYCILQILPLRSVNLTTVRMTGKKLCAKQKVMLRQPDTRNFGGRFAFDIKMCNKFKKIADMP